MKYFYDTEFIEGIRKPIKPLPIIGNFNKPKWNIDLISIGIISEDEREYYAISNEFNPDDANEWVKKNVLEPILDEYIHSFYGDRRNMILDVLEKKSLSSQIRTLQKWIGKSNKQIADEIQQFCRKEYIDTSGHPTANSIKTEKIELYGYYSAYDHVLLSSLFGAMINLPPYFPMYTIDLQQMFVDEVDRIKWDVPNNVSDGVYNETDGIRYLTLKEKITCLKDDIYYPKQVNEHNALQDAKWNKELYNYIKRLRNLH